MNYKSVLFGLGMILLLTGCGKDQPRELFSMHHSLDFTIQAGSNTFDTHIYRFVPVFSQYEDRLAAGNLEDADVMRVDPKGAEVAAIFGDEDLDFIQEISIQIFETANGGNRREIFFLDPVPANVGTALNPFPALPDIKEFVAENHFGIEVLLRYRFIPTRNIDMRLEFLFAARK